MRYTVYIRLCCIFQDYLVECFHKHKVDSCQFEDERCIQNKNTHNNTVNSSNDEEVIYSLEMRDIINPIEENDRVS